MTKKTTRLPVEATQPKGYDPRLSEQVRWYLQERGIPAPQCWPQVFTPEPVNAPGAVFDPARVDKVLDVLRRLRHTQGDLAGKPLIPDPWQIAYIIAPVFGWVRPDGKGGYVRIIRKLFVEVPRKNGKSTLAGGLALYLTTADGELGAQVYAAASGKDQAKFVFDPVKELAERAPDLKPYVKALAEKIVHRATASYFRVISRIGDLIHGANVHGAIVDELHVHKTPGLLRGLETGMGARKQPLLIIITTAGDESNESVYAKWHTRIEKLAKRTFKDYSVLGVIWAADKKDDPFSEKTWRKANPGYGISPTAQFLEDEATAAKQSPSNLASFKRLHLNVRTSATNKLFSLTIWDKAAGPLKWRDLEKSLEGQQCYGGLDLAQTRDLTAFAMIFPSAAGIYRGVFRFWIPEENIDERSQRDGIDYRVWVESDLIRTTPGNSTDYDVIERDILADAELFGLQAIAFDPAFAYQMAGNLNGRGIPMVPFRQTFMAMGPPTSDWLGLLKDNKFQHGGHPVLRYMAEATEAEQDMNGILRPSKRKSTVHIDGIVASVMALDTAIRNADPIIYTAA